MSAYQSLHDVLCDALAQAAEGKGKERHAEDGQAFEEQWIMRLAPLSFTVGQACKKAIESLRLPPDRAERELLGAINYLAAEVLRRRKEIA